MPQLFTADDQLNALVYGNSDYDPPVEEPLPGPQTAAGHGSTPAPTAPNATYQASNYAEQPVNYQPGSAYSPDPIPAQQPPPAATAPPGGFTGGGASTYYGGSASAGLTSQPSNETIQTAYPATSPSAAPPTQPPLTLGDPGPRANPASERPWTTIGAGQGAPQTSLAAFGPPRNDPYRDAMTLPSGPTNTPLDFSGLVQTAERARTYLFPPTEAAAAPGLDDQLTRGGGGGGGGARPPGTFPPGINAQGGVVTPGGRAAFQGPGINARTGRIAQRGTQAVRGGMLQTQPPAVGTPPTAPATLPSSGTIGRGGGRIGAMNSATVQPPRARAQIAGPAQPGPSVGSGVGTGPRPGRTMPPGASPTGQTMRPRTRTQIGGAATAPPTTIGTTTPPPATGSGIGRGRAAGILGGGALAIGGASQALDQTLNPARDTRMADSLRRAGESRNALMAEPTDDPFAGQGLPGVDPGLSARRPGPTLVLQPDGGVVPGERTSDAFAAGTGLTDTPALKTFLLDGENVILTDPALVPPASLAAARERGELPAALDAAEFDAILGAGLIPAEDADAYRAALIGVPIMAPAAWAPYIATDAPAEVTFTPVPEATTVPATGTGDGSSDWVDYGSGGSRRSSGGGGGGYSRGGYSRGGYSGGGGGGGGFDFGNLPPGFGGPDGFMSGMRNNPMFAGLFAEGFPFDGDEGDGPRGLRGRMRGRDRMPRANRRARRGRDRDRTASTRQLRSGPDGASIRDGDVNLTVESAQPPARDDEPKRKKKGRR